MNRPAMVDLCLELLAPLGDVRARRMFGGWGLWAGDVFVALVLNDQLYLKTRPETTEAFAAAGCQPFTYSAKGRTVSIGFWSAPAEAMESPALMEPWARLALKAALAARGATAPRRRRRALTNAP
jgi:DNA transformation protein